MIGMISATVRDIAIIIVAVQSIVIGILLGVLVWQLWRLVKMIQTEITPIIDDAQETLSTLRGTTAFVSENVVNPVVKTSGNIVRYRRTLQALTAELMPRRHPSPPAPPAATELPPP
jgi:hypothetical protein